MNKDSFISKWSLVGYYYYLVDSILSSPVKDTEDLVKLTIYERELGDALKHLYDYSQSIFNSFCSECNSELLPFGRDVFSDHSFLERFGLVPVDDPLDVVNAHPKFDDLGINSVEK